MASRSEPQATELILPRQGEYLATLSSADFHRAPKRFRRPDRPANNSRGVRRALEVIRQSSPSPRPVLTPMPVEAQAVTEEEISRWRAARHDRPTLSDDGVRCLVWLEQTFKRRTR